MMKLKLLRIVSGRCAWTLPILLSACASGPTVYPPKAALTARVPLEQNSVQRMESFLEGKLPPPRSAGQNSDGATASRTE